MDGRIKSGHDGVVVAVEEQEHGEPGAARPSAMPPPIVMPGLDPLLSGCRETVSVGAREGPIQRREGVG